MFLLLFLAFGVVFASGILSMVEAALFSYSVSKARVKAAKGDILAKKAIEIREKPFQTIATFVILSTLASVGGSIAVGSLAASRFSSAGIGIFSAILTFLTVLFAEIIPKNIGERWSYIIFPYAAIPLRWLTLIFTPFIFILQFVSKPFTQGASPFTTSEEEIALLTKMGAKEGNIEADEAEMIQRVFRLNDITAGDMMTPRSFVAFIDGAKSVREVADFVKANKNSRLPVFEKDENNIIGIVHQRDILRAIADGEFEKKVSEYAREAMMVPDTRLGDALLRDFQENRSHLAIVVSEYGNIVGVVGLEDVLEELVGEIIDEKDVVPELIKRVSKNEIIAHGQTRISSINHFFNLEIKSRKTLNGYLLDKFGHLPEPGDKIEKDGVIFQIEEMGARQIDKARIIRKDADIK